MGKPRGVVSVTKWLVPGVILVLVPKCPACFAGYLAIATGVGVSATTAGNLRSLLVILCLGGLAVVAVRSVCRLIRSLRVA